MHLRRYNCASFVYLDPDMSCYRFSNGLRLEFCMGNYTPSIILILYLGSLSLLNIEYWFLFCCCWNCHAFDCFSPAFNLDQFPSACWGKVSSQHASMGDGVICQRLKSSLLVSSNQKTLFHMFDEPPMSLHTDITKCLVNFFVIVCQIFTVAILFLRYLTFGKRNATHLDSDDVRHVTIVKHSTSLL